MPQDNHLPGTGRLMLLGTGQLGRAVIHQARQREHIIASTRNPERIFELAELAVEPLIMPYPSAEIVMPLCCKSDLLVSFPPDGTTDAELAPACRQARRIIYVSCSTVNSLQAERIDGNGCTDSADDCRRLRLAAEAIWREQGAVVLHAAEIYSPQNGIHRQLAAGKFQMPADTSQLYSCIHVDDLARVILAAFESNRLAGNTYLVDDGQPAPLSEVAGWLLQEMNLPAGVPAAAGKSRELPTGAALSQAALPAARAILKELAVTLAYSSYKEGYRQCLHESGS
jgi:hypothetical protein